MGSASLAVAADRPHLTYSFLRALDRPAREALELSRRPWLATVAPALLGLFLVAGATALVGFVGYQGLRLVPRLDALRAIIEALLVVVPGITVFTIYLRLRISARAFLAATALGLLAAGLMAVCVLPLMALLTLVSQEVRTVLLVPPLLVPGLALATAAALPVRVITSLDASDKAWWLSRAFAFFLGAVFLVRMHQALSQLPFWKW